MPAAPRSRAFRLLFGLLLTLTAAALLEVILQVGALIVWQDARTEARAGDSGPVIVCLGDSFTYGMGTSGPGKSYPDQLQAILADRGAEVSVIRCAMPGRNSRQALELLDGQIARYRPDIVYVLLGRNDQWSKPDVLTLDSPAAAAVEAPQESFRIEWRTARLFAWLVGRLTDDAPKAAAATTLREHRPEVALEILEQQLSQDPDNPWVRASLVTAYTSLGRAARAQEQLDWLEQAMRRQPTEAVASALLGALRAAGASEQRLLLATLLTDLYPNSPQVWQALGWESYQRGNIAIAVPAIAKAVSLVPADNPIWRGNMLRKQAVILTRHDRAAAIRSCVEALLLEGPENAPRWGTPGCQPEQLDAVLDELAVGGETREWIEAYFARVLGWDGREFEDVLENHLRQIVLRCRSTGAQPVLVSYPLDLPYVERPMNRVAQATGAGRVKTTDEFARRGEGKPPDTFFIEDGHCNDAGYRLLAELVAEDALTRLRR